VPTRGSAQTVNARRRRGWPWLLVAAVLLVLGAWVMRGAEPPPRPDPPQVNLPRSMTSPERARAVERQTWVPVPLFDAGLQDRPAKPQDPLLALMPEKVEYGAVVAEVNAIFNSELGPLMFDCLFAGAQDRLRGFRDAGFDPLQQIDRVAVIDDVLVMTGQLEHLPLPQDGVAKDYGPSGRIIERETSRGREYLATWKNQLSAVGDDEASLKRLLDTLDRGASPGPKALDESQAFGELYGVMGPKGLGLLFGEEDQQLKDVIVSATKGLSLHVDVSHDLGVVADVEPNDSTKTEELRRTMSSVLSLARLKAQAKGQTREADLLDLARVRGASGAGGFRVEAGVPHEVMKGLLTQCVERQTKRAAQRAAADAGR